jgi:phospholipase C
MVLPKRLMESLVAVVSGLLLLALCGCQGLSNSTTTTTTTTPPGSLNSINHIIFMVQENRSFDTYFGQLPAYWQANGYPQASQQFNGLPTGASNPAYNGTTTPGTTTVPAYHTATECIEDLSPSWDESHEDWNLQFPASNSPLNNGFVYNAASYALAQNPQYNDTPGYRAMGYYNWTDLPFYYFMASDFAISDNWFSPALDRTQINRMYLFAATSQGYAYPPGTDSADNAPLTAKTIFDELTAANISWKVYATDYDLDPTTRGTYLMQFKQFNPLPSNVVPGTNFLNDIQNDSTFPSVAFIEGGYLSGRDEHPDNNVQVGAAYVASLINGFMASPIWKDSVFILTYDEAGGTYDHVAPIAEPNPDGIAPIDLLPNDICTTGGANCDFNYSGFRVPLIVISPYSQKNYVDHTPEDYTAILKLIETRFNLPALNKRDAAQTDMTQFFDFQNVPWATPPNNVPSQPTTGACNPDALGYPPAQ